MIFLLSLGFFLCRVRLPSYPLFVDSLFEVGSFSQIDQIDLEREVGLLYVKAYLGKVSCIQSITLYGDVHIGVGAFTLSGTGAKEVDVSLWQVVGKVGYECFDGFHKGIIA